MYNQEKEGNLGILPWVDEWLYPQGFKKQRGSNLNCRFSLQNKGHS